MATQKRTRRKPAQQKATQLKPEQQAVADFMEWVWTHNQ